MIFSAKIARYLLILSFIIALAIVVPEFYSTLFDQSIPNPKMYYSSITNEFLITENRTNDFYRGDVEGNEMSREEFERLTPLYSYKQLMYREEMPDSVQGVPIDIQELRLNNVYLSLHSRDIFRYSIPLNPLFESDPSRPDLQMPEEFFRIGDKFEFINCVTNNVLPELSKLFNNAFLNKGFIFPAKKIFGNPSTKKPFDEGYFVVDSSEQLFHIKRIMNKPYIVKVNLIENIEVQHIILREMRLKEFYSLLISKDNRLFLISYDNYKMIELPSDGYDYTNSRLIFKGNLLYREISFLAENSIKTIVTNRDYKTVDTYSKKWESNNESTVGLIGRSIFPFRISLKDVNKSFVDFYFDISSYQFLLGNFIFLLIGIILFATKIKKNPSTKFIDLVIILFTGVYGLIAVLFIRDES
jgi:uncharacterized protein DUF4857